MTIVVTIVVTTVVSVVISSTCSRTERTVGRFTYRKWDSTEESRDIGGSEVLDPGQLLDTFTDDVLAGGSVDASLREILYSGKDTELSGHILGLREILDQLRKKRLELQGSLGSSQDDTYWSAELMKILKEEAQALDELEIEAEKSKDERRIGATQALISDRLSTLKLLPSGATDCIEALDRYEFVSTSARTRFKYLSNQFQKEMNADFVKGLVGVSTHSIALMTSDQSERVSSALEALNQMIDQLRQFQSLSPTFEEFMVEYQDIFPRQIADFDEFLRQLAQRWIAARTPPASDSLQGLQGSFVEHLPRDSVGIDSGILKLVDRLFANLRSTYPDFAWDRFESSIAKYSLASLENSSFYLRVEQIRELERTELELQLVVDSSTVRALDIDRIRTFIGEDSANSLSYFSRLSRSLEDSGFTAVRNGRTELTPRAIERIGRRALNKLFEQSGLAGHVGSLGLIGPVVSKSSNFTRTTRQSISHEIADRTEMTRPYEYGDDLHLNLSATLSNSLRREGGGIPIRVSLEDFELDEIEDVARSAIVLALDVSISMPMRNNFVPAKQTAIALQTLIASNYPRDYLGIVGFSEVAREIKPINLVTTGWDGTYGTNLEHALVLCRQMLCNEHGRKQIVVITDGEPTAHIDPSGEVFFHSPPTSETLKRTMAEAIRCSRAGIGINFFALGVQGAQFNFIEEMARSARVQIFHVSPDSLGFQVLSNFVVQHQLDCAS